LNSTIDENVMFPI